MLCFVVKRGAPWPHQSSSGVTAKIRNFPFFSKDNQGILPSSDPFVCNIYIDQTPALLDTFGWSHGGGRLLTPGSLLPLVPQLPKAQRATARKAACFFIFPSSFFSVTSLLLNTLKAAAFSQRWEWQIPMPPFVTSMGIAALWNMKWVFRQLHPLASLGSTVV